MHCIVHQYGSFKNVVLHLLYLHANVIDIHGFTIIMVTIGGVVINFHCPQQVCKKKHLNFFLKFNVCMLAKFEKMNLGVTIIGMKTTKFTRFPKLKLKQGLT